MLLYAAFIGLWVPLNLWMMPWHTLRVGQVPPEGSGFQYVGLWVLLNFWMMPWHTRCLPRD